jgi:hypothetical protein
VVQLGSLLFALSDMGAGTSRGKPAAGRPAYMHLKW